MASICQPDEVVRLDPTYPWNQLSTYGFKWHLFFRDGLGMIRKTACGIVLSHTAVEERRFSEVKAKDLCGTCFKGHRVVD